MSRKDSSEQILALIAEDPSCHKAHRDRQALIWLGQSLAKARKRSGLTQSQAADRAGMTQADLSRLENGLPAKGITFTTLVGLSEALGFNIVFELRPPSGTTVSRNKPARHRNVLDGLVVRDAHDAPGITR